MDTTLTTDIKVKYSEMDHNLALKPFSLLNFLQDSASESAENLGFGYSFISKNNYAWFLIKYRMEFDEYPIGVYDLTVKTRPRGYNRLFAYRDFEIFENEKLLGRVFSVWSIVDINSRMTVPINVAIPDNEYMQPFQKQETDLAFSKIKTIQKVDIEKEFEVRYNDIDVNGHANNGNYIVWAFEPLSLEFKSNHKIKTIDMMFKKEAKYDEKLIVQVEFLNENTTVHVVKNINDDELCLVQCNWV